MGRLLNEKCWACSLLTAAKARKLHDEALGGDGCWQIAASPTVGGPITGKSGAGGEAIAHSEDVASWTAAILEWLQTTLLSVSIAELSDSLEMPWIEVWLGVLFSGFQLEQRGEFYALIWVKRSGDQAMTLRQDGS